MLDLPEPRNTDPAGVAWALETAGALWRRHDRVTALIWLRRAAENASDLGLDKRAMEIAKGAADAREVLLDDTSEDAIDLARTLDLSEHELPTVQRMVAASVWDEDEDDEETQDAIDAYESDSPTSNDSDEDLRRARAELIASVREMAPTIDPSVFEALAGLLDVPGSAAMDDAITVTY
jgi:hypothetical protein